MPCVKKALKTAFEQKIVKEQCMYNKRGQIYVFYHFYLKFCKALCQTGLRDGFSKATRSGMNVNTF